MYIVQTVVELVDNISSICWGGFSADQWIERLCAPHRKLPPVNGAPVRRNYSSNLNTLISKYSPTFDGSRETIKINSPIAQLSWFKFAWRFLFKMLLAGTSKVIAGTDNFVMNWKLELNWRAFPQPQTFDHFEYIRFCFNFGQPEWWKMPNLKLRERELYQVCCTLGFIFKTIQLPTMEIGVGSMLFSSWRMRLTASVLVMIPGVGRITRYYYKNLI